MSNKYDQPFCIIGSVGRFAPCYEAKRYLPPIAPIHDSEEVWTKHERRYQEFGLEENGAEQYPHLHKKVYQEAKYPKQKSYCGIRK